MAITKRMPAAAGLAGGSSDAAATLVALERLFELDLSARLRYEMAASIGSDVPFFLWPGAQLAMGRGQVLKGVELPELSLLIAMPDLGLSTAAVYRWRDEDAEVSLRDFVPRARDLSARAQAARTVAEVAALVHNDLQASVTARKPAVAELCERLIDSGALAASMTGSGGAVFGIFAAGGAAAAARKALAPARAWCAGDLQPVVARRGAPGGRASGGPTAPPGGGPRGASPGGPRRRSGGSHGGPGPPRG